MNFLVHWLSLYTHSVLLFSKSYFEVINCQAVYFVKKYPPGWTNEQLFSFQKSTVIINNIGYLTSQ